MLRRVGWIVVAVLVACDQAPADRDAGHDAAAGDAGGMDGGGADAGGAMDGGIDGGGSPDASPPDAGTDAGSTARPLGSVRGIAPAACGMGAPPGATCTQLTVACPGIDDADAIVAVAEPTGAARGTIFTHGGGGGMGFYGLHSREWIAAGFRIAAVRWTTEWEQTAMDGILAAACRPSTVMQWVWETVHGSDRATAFCGAGHSGGSGVLSYALAHYGMESVLDYAALSAGPPFGRIDYGCAPSTYTGPPRMLCPELPNAPIDLPAARMNAWENTTTCGSMSPDPAELARWAADSVVSPGADYDYPRTLVTFWNCATMSNGTAGGAYFYSTEVLSPKQVRCFTDCRGEPLGPTGDAAFRDAMIAECVPRH